jgi:hypothetical protein
MNIWYIYILVLIVQVPFLKFTIQQQKSNICGVCKFSYNIYII